MIKLFTKLVDCRTKIRQNTGLKSCDVSVATTSSTEQKYDGLGVSVSWQIDGKTYRVDRVYERSLVNSLDLDHFADWFINKYKKEVRSGKLGQL